MSREPTDWIDEVRRVLAAGDGHRGYLVKFPEYRPDLAKALAHHLGMELFDFRAEVMSRLGASAHTLELDAMQRSLESRCMQRGIVAFNLEALLATKTASARKTWMTDFVGGTYANPIVVPLAIFCPDADASLPHTFSLDADKLPDQSLISRLAN
jgi:hypothetical protein